MSIIGENYNWGSFSSFLCLLRNLQNYGKKHRELQAENCPEYYQTKDEKPLDESKNA